MPPKRIALRKPSHAERVAISTNSIGRVKRLGGFEYGDIYLGRVKFKGGKWHRVAVKRFKRRLSGRTARAYQKAINDLTRAGVRLPKMGMVKTEAGEWVQVSELFGSRKNGSKFVNKSNLVIASKKGRREAVVEMTKVANAGYAPHEDLVEPFRKQKKGARPLDLDKLVQDFLHFGKRNAETRATFLADMIETIAEATNTAGYKALCEAALETASPEIKGELKKVLPYFPE